MKLAAKILVLGAVLCMSTACTTIKTNELSREESVVLSGKTLVLTKYKQLPGFAAQTALNVQFGMLGAAAAISNGNKIIANGEIEDPAIEISRQLAEGLQASHGLKVISDHELRAENNSLSDLVSLYDGHDYILDVRTAGWNSIYYNSDWNSYRVYYHAHARLIDTSTKTVVAETLCSARPKYEDTNEGPSYEELKNGVGLRKELARAVEFCVDEIRGAVNLQQDVPKEDVDLLTMY